MVLSDGGVNVAEAKRQLDIHGDRYFFCFSDVLAAARFGTGNVVITEAYPSALRKIIKKNRVKAVLDITETPMSTLSKATLSAADGKVKYVKCVKCERHSGTERCLSYGDVADKIRDNDGNTLMCTASYVVSAIAKETGEDIRKMFAFIEKSVSFNTEKALEYSIPLLNVSESDMTDGEYAAEYMLKKTSSNMMICTEEVDKGYVVAALKLGVKVIFTHGSGIEYPKTVADIRDALIEIHGKRSGKKV